MFEKARVLLTSSFSFFFPFLANQNPRQGGSAEALCCMISRTSFFFSKFWLLKGWVVEELERDKMNEGVLIARRRGLKSVVSNHIFYSSSAMLLTSCFFFPFLANRTRQFEALGCMISRTAFFFLFF